MSELHAQRCLAVQKEELFTDSLVLKKFSVHETFFFCRVLKVNILLSVSIKREIVHMQSRFEKVSNNFFLLSNTKS